MTPNSQVIYAGVLTRLLRESEAWLDLGCGHQFLPDWMDQDERFAVSLPRRTVGLDLDLASLRRHTRLTFRIAGDVQQLPIRAESFDLVTANMVVEHVVNPEELFDEVARILRPGGKFLLHTPNVHGYTTMLTRCIPSSLRPRIAHILQGRAAEDVYRTFYRANSVESLKRVAENRQFRVSELRTIGSSAQLFRVPILGQIEDGWLRLLNRKALEHWRPCILGHFVKADAA